MVKRVSSFKVFYALKDNYAKIVLQFDDGSQEEVEEVTSEMLAAALAMLNLQDVYWDGIWLRTHV